MRGGAASVEQAGAGEQECARADGGGATRGRGCTSDPLDEDGVGHGVPGSGAAGDDQRVEAANVVDQGGVGNDAQPTRALERRTVTGEDPDFVAGLPRPHRRDQLAGSVEHLERTGDVEALDAGEREDRDAAGGGGARHGSIIAQLRLVRKDRFPTISAMPNPQV